jgi:hypothetical protein
VTDGRGGPLLLYHGKRIKPDDLKSIRALNKEEARAHFGDPTLDAAMIIELKDDPSRKNH